MKIIEHLLSSRSRRFKGSPLCLTQLFAPGIGLGWKRNIQVSLLIPTLESWDQECYPPIKLTVVQMSKEVQGSRNLTSLLMMGFVRPRYSELCSSNLKMSVRGKHLRHVNSGRQWRNSGSAAHQSPQVILVRKSRNDGLLFAIGKGGREKGLGGPPWAQSPGTPSHRALNSQQTLLGLS